MSIGTSSCGFTKNAAGTVRTRLVQLALSERVKVLKLKIVSLDGFKRQRAS